MSFLRFKWQFLLGIFITFVTSSSTRSAFESLNRASGRPLDATTEIPSKEAELKSESNFNCLGRPSGHYADVGSGCTIFYYCDPSGMKSQFKCPRLNLFHQKYNVCDWNFNVKCEESEKYYPNGEEVVNKNVKEFDKEFVPNKKQTHKSRGDNDEDVQIKTKAKNSYEEDYDEPEEIKPKNIRPEKNKGESFRGHQPFEEENDEDDGNHNQEDDYKGKNPEIPKSGFPPPAISNLQPFGRPPFRSFSPQDKLPPVGRPSFEFATPRKEFGSKSSFATLVENRQSRKFDNNEKSERKLNSNFNSEKDYDEDENGKEQFKLETVAVTSKFGKPETQKVMKQTFTDNINEDLSSDNDFDYYYDQNEKQVSNQRNEFQPVNSPQFQKTFSQEHYLRHDPEQGEINLDNKKSFANSFNNYADFYNHPKEGELGGQNERAFLDEGRPRLTEYNEELERIVFPQKEQLHFGRGRRNFDNDFSLKTSQHINE